MAMKPYVMFHTVIILQYATDMFWGDGFSNKCHYVYIHVLIIPGLNCD